MDFLIPHIVNGFLSFFDQKKYFVYGECKKRAVRVSVNGFRGDTRQPKKFAGKKKCGKNVCKWFSGRDSFARPDLTVEKKCGKNACKWFSGRHSCCSFEYVLEKK